MRGLSSPPASMIAPQVNGYHQGRSTSALPLDRARAKKLLAEAGYPQRLRGRRSTAPTTATSTTRRSARRSPRCWRRSASRPSCNAMPRAHLLPEDPELRHQLLHAGLGRADLRRALRAAEPAAHASAQGGDGNYNLGRYSNPKVDAAGRAASRSRPTRRSATPRSREALQIAQRRRGAHPAAPPGDPVGDAHERRAWCTAPTTASSCAGSRSTDQTGGPAPRRTARTRGSCDGMAQAGTWTRPLICRGRLR